MFFSGGATAINLKLFMSETPLILHSFFFFFFGELGLIIANGLFSAQPL